MPHLSPNSRGRGSRLIGLAMLALVVGLGCDVARAQLTRVVGATAGGIFVNVDAWGVDGNGYRPMIVTIASTPPTTVDKTFTVEILTQTGPYSRPRCDLMVSRDIELPAGSGPVQATLSVPQAPLTEVYAINVYEDGRYKKNLSTASGWAPFGGMNPSNESDFPAPVVLLVGDATEPDSSKLMTVLELNQSNWYQYQAAYGGMNISLPNPEANAPNLPTLFVESVAGLPLKWIDYTSLDVVCLSLEKLAEVAEHNPAAYTAIMRWTRAGGNLWVFGVGADWRGIGRLEELTEMGPTKTEPAESLTAESDAPNPLPAGWQAPDKEDYTRQIRVGLSELGATYYDNTTGYYDPYGMPSPSEYLPAEEPPPVEVPPPTSPHFLYREHELGLVVALAAGDPFPGTESEWRGVFNAMGPTRWLWHCRHGLSQIRENEDYWKFLIPGVGLVPVIEFCIMISLFALAIGPLNYWLLRRAKRLHLLIVTIPLGAALVTFGLFGYALISDGLGTRVRARSLTLLDQRSDEAVCWSRQSYYAGLTPRDGLTFADDVVVLPLEFAPIKNYNDPAKGRELIWSEQGDEQWLASGWLRSRTPMQLLTVRSRESRVGIDLLEPAAGADRPRIKNRLDTRILQLLVRADDGQLHWAEGVGQGETAALAEFTPANRESLLALHRDNQPALPDGDHYDYYGGFFGINTRYYGYYGGDTSPPASQESGRLETVLNGPVRSMAGGNLALLEPGSYLAVVERSPEVQLGLDKANEEAGYHVILGRW